MNIALIGPRGVGKSKISRKLSKLTGMTVISTDMIATYEAGGISISEYIKSNNQDWRKFRDLEHSILLKLQDSRDLILDCGGGILFDLDSDGKEILSTRKTEILKKNFTIIRLSRDTEYLVNKMSRTSNRPNLSEVETYSQILKKRNPHYDSLAHFSIHIKNESPEEIAFRIQEKLGKLEPK